MNTTQPKLNFSDAEAVKSHVQKLSFYPIMFQAARSLRNLGILQYLKERRRAGFHEVGAIAEAVNITEYGVRVLLEAGLSLELVDRDEQDRYAITPAGRFLISDRQTEVNIDFVNDVCYIGSFEMEDAIRNYKPEGLKHFGTWDTIYEALSQLPEPVRKSWFAFDHYYSDAAFPEALKIVFRDKPKRLADVGGNTGKWSMTCAAYDADVEVTIVDLPGQLNDAMKNVKARGLEGRIKAHETNVLRDDVQFPLGMDAFWMSQFLDCFAENEIIHILSNAAKAMDDKCTLYIMETYWDRQEHEASTYCLHGTSLYFTAMANGNSKMYHSEAMKRCVEAAGLRVVEEHDQVGSYHTIFACRKA
ncbi:MAG: SAM-dependent methyltransferase [Flavobacteriales bacterium]|nr:SAM-dependent methyltransferase [Flavobacteriales bacterium]